MKNQCVMCGRDIAQGILCEKCDRPKRSSSKQVSQKSAPASPPAPPAPAAPPPPSASPASPAPPASAAHAPATAAEPQAQPDPFPKARVVPFPVEATSLAVTSMYEVLSTAGIASVLIGADRSVKFISDSARVMLKLPSGDPVTPRAIEMRLGVQLPVAQESHTSEIFVDGQKVRLSVIPLSGGASGSVLILKGEDENAESEALNFVRETVITPLLSLHAALSVALQKGKKDPLLQDAVSTLDQILSSLELSPRIELAPHRGNPTSLSTILQHVTGKATALAQSKQVRLQLDAPEADEPYADSAGLERTLFTLVDNAIHYVPQGGQVVLGLRFLEHKGNTLLLFFVMDNGPVVPEEIRTRIFDADFVPSPDLGRSGKNLASCREFAAAHNGQVWVESKTGKACTFFLRIAP